MRPLRAAVLLGVKDARVLWRSPATVALLLGYPILVALLVAVALQTEGRQPAVALVNLDTSGTSVRVGQQRLSVADYTDRLAEEVDLKPLGPEQAQRELEAGRVAAIITLPEGFVADLRSGLAPAQVILTTSPRQPIVAESIRRRLEAAVFRFNQSLAGEYVANVIALVDLVVNGGDLGIFGRSVEAIGLVRARDLVQEVQATLRQRGDDEVADRLDPIVTFIDGAAANLDLARPAANAIRSPIELEVNEEARGSQPLSAFGFAGALVVSLGLAGALLAAATLSGERDENVLVRLRRGLVPAPALVGGKVALTAVACMVVGLVLLALVALLTALAVGRWALWLPVLLLAGAAFGAFGTLIGAAARDSRTALLATLMLSVPLVAVGLIPNSAPADVVAALVPFGPAFDSFQTLLVEPEVPTRVLLEMGHLALLAVAFGAAASWVLAARPT